MINQINNGKMNLIKTYIRTQEKDLLVSIYINKPVGLLREVTIIGNIMQWISTEIRDFHRFWGRLWKSCGNPFDL